MKNLFDKKSMSEQFADNAGQIITQLILILLNTLELVVKLLKKFNRGIRRGLTFLAVFYFLYAALPYYATAPKTARAMDGQKEMIVHTDYTVKGIVLSMTGYEFGTDQVPAMEKLLNHESGFDPKAVNPNSGACGLFQNINCNYKSMDIQDQIQWGFDYIKSRYGNPVNAWKFWQTPHLVSGKMVNYY